MMVVSHGDVYSVSSKRRPSFRGVCLFDVSQARAWVRSQFKGQERAYFGQVLYYMRNAARAVRQRVGQGAFSRVTQDGRRARTCISQR